MADITAPEKRAKAYGLIGAAFSGGFVLGPVLGSLAYANDHPATIDLIASGRVDPYQFIMGRIGLDDIVESGFNELITNKEENVKVLVHP